MKSSTFSYEEALKELNTILNNLQNDKYSLEEINHAIDKANKLIQQCEIALRNIQDKVNKIQLDTED